MQAHKKQIKSFVINATSGHHAPIQKLHIQDSLHFNAQTLDRIRLAHIDGSGFLRDENLKATVRIEESTAALNTLSRDRPDRARTALLR